MYRNQYKVTVRHDNGIIRIVTRAESFRAAIDRIMHAENCTRSAILRCAISR